MAADSARVEEALMEASQPELEATQAAAQAETAGEQRILEGGHQALHAGGSRYTCGSSWVVNVSSCDPSGFVRNMQK